MNKKNKEVEAIMTNVEKLELGVFASLLIIVLPAIFVASHWLVS
jgi:hypothetical protein